jgi:hypothetical protein
MDKDYLVLKRASASRPSGEWNDDDFDVLADGGVVGRIMKAAAVPVGMSWMWTLAFGYHEDRTPTHGYEATREAPMAAFQTSGVKFSLTGVPAARPMAQKRTEMTTTRTHFTLEAGCARHRG